MVLILWHRRTSQKTFPVQNGATHAPRILVPGRSGGAAAPRGHCQRRGGTRPAQPRWILAHAPRLILAHGRPCKPNTLLDRTRPSLEHACRVVHRWLPSLPTRQNIVHISWRVRQREAYPNSGTPHAGVRRCSSLRRVPLQLRLQACRHGRGSLPTSFGRGH